MRLDEEKAFRLILQEFPFPIGILDQELMKFNFVNEQFANYFEKVTGKD